MKKITIHILSFILFLVMAGGMCSLFYINEQVQAKESQKAYDKIEDYCKTRHTDFISDVNDFSNILKEYKFKKEAKKIKKISKRMEKALLEKDTDKALKYTSEIENTVNSIKNTSDHIVPISFISEREKFIEKIEYEKKTIDILDRNIKYYSKEKDNIFGIIRKSK